VTLSEREEEVTGHSKFFNQRVNRQEEVRENDMNHATSTTSFWALLPLNFRSDTGEAPKISDSTHQVDW